MIPTIYLSNKEIFASGLTFIVDLVVHIYLMLYAVFTYIFPKVFKLVREGLKKMVGFIHLGWLAGVSRRPKSNQKKNCFQTKYKDDQNGLIHPEN